MKIVTVNVPEPYINAIDKLTGHDGLYPSRSELIRVAVRQFLLKELRMANKLALYQKKSFPGEEKFDNENYVRVPVSDNPEDDNTFKSFKTFRIVRK